MAESLVYVTTGQGNAAPAVTDGTVYAGDGFGSVLYALDAATGEQRWSSGQLQRGLSAFDAVSGTERWHVTT
ncbi:MAG: PQQ-binding-like beta-propeller repeat protein, partial [Chloroflexota bacterium]|nr:PQQ-binding-like beta-propeller repeat protein [Chloroflexota bacterium]